MITVVFLLFQTPERVSWLAQRMPEEGGHAVALLSSEMTKEECIAVLNRFREGQYWLLITNVPLWGIDLGEVNSSCGCDQTIGCDMFQRLSEKLEFQ